ncbi:MAG: MG2 domain-containing protein, partial [Opitutales bacterium]
MVDAVRVGYRQAVLICLTGLTPFLALAQEAGSSSDSAVFDALAMQEEQAVAQATEELIADGKRLVSERSFAQAANAFEEALALLPADVALRFELRWRYFDSAARAVTARTDGRERTLQQLEQELRTLSDKLFASRDGRPPELWAKVQQSIGLVCAKLNRVEAMEVAFERALDWWAGAPASEAARNAYLGTVDEILRLMDTGGSRSEGTLPRFAHWLEGAIELAEAPVQKAQYLIRLAELRVRRGGLEAAQARESFERALKTAEDTDFWREAAFAFVAYLRAYGKPAWTDDGDLRFEPDDTEAVGLLHRLAADPGAYRAPEAQRLLETITRTTVSLGGGRAFRPGQSVSVAAYFRNPEDLPIRAGRLDLAGITCTTEGFRAPFQTTVFESTLRSDAYAPYVPHRETFELGRLQAGLYQARTLGPAGEVFSEVIAVTRAALLVRTDREGLHFWLGQAATGKPLAGTVDVFGAERRSRRNGTEDPMPWERQRIQLAEDGTGFLPWSALGGATVDLWRVLARSEAGPAVAHGYRTYQPGDENAVRCYAFTDRPVYRPGQKVHWRMFLRQLTGGDWSVPDPASPPIQYTIESARGTTLAAGELTLNAYGAAGGTLELSEDVELGEASLRLERKVKRSPNPFAPLFAESLSARIFRIEGYRRPDFEVKIATAEPKAGFRPGDDLSITVSADYADSGPVIDAPIELEVIRKALPHRAGGDLTPTQSDHAQDEPERFQARTDVEGEAHFELEVPYTTGADFQFTLRATVEGPDGAQVQTRQEIVVTEQAYFVEVDTDRTLIQPGEAVTANVSARHGNGSPASVDGELTLERLRYRELWVGPEGERVSGATLRERTRQEAVFGQPLDWTQWRLEAREESREPVATLQVATDADGRAGERITLTEPGRYTLSWQSHDSERRPIKASVGLTVAGPGSNLLPDGRFRMETPKTVYAIGQRVPVLLTCPVPTAHALLTVETDRATESLIVPLSEGSGWAELVVSEAWTPSVTLRAEFIGGFGLRTATTTLEVPPKQFELNVTVTPASPTATPGSELPIALEVTRGDGSPAEGEITLSVYDAALEPIRAPMPKDPFAHFYGQREAVGRVSYLSSLRQMPFVAETPGRLVSVTEEASNGLFSVEGASFRARAKRADAPSSTHASEIIVRHDLRETAAWIPGMALDAEGRATAIIDLPDDTTRWVARAWAGGLPARFGTGEATFTTRLPLTAGLKLPQFLVAGDKTLTRGTVLNQTGEAATVVTVASVDGALSLQTKQAATLTLQPGETGVVELPLETALPGTGRVAFRARAEPLGDGLRRTVPVVPAGLPLTETLGGRLQAPLNEMLWEVPHYDPNGATASLSLAPTPAVALVDALPYLAAQPDTLTEQVVSRFVPLVVGHAMLLRLGLNEAEANAVIHATLPQEAAADNRPALAGRIRASLAALAEHQNPDGGWGWWCGADTSDPYMTAYAVWGLTL